MNESLTDWITIFIAGTYDGQDFDEGFLDRLVANYEPSYHEAPLCIGHPADSEPAFGWIAAVRRTGKALQVKVRDVAKEFKELWNARRFNKLSVSFYRNLDGKGPWLRHLGALGAAPPRIKGMPTALFTDGDSGQVVIFSYGESGVALDSAQTGPGTFTQDEYEWLKAKLPAMIAEGLGNARKHMSNMADAAGKKLEAVLSRLENIEKRRAEEFYEGTMGAGAYGEISKDDFIENMRERYADWINRWHAERAANRVAESMKQSHKKKLLNAPVVTAFDDTNSIGKGSAAQMTTPEPGTPEYYLNKAREADAEKSRKREIAKGYFLAHKDDRSIRSMGYKTADEFADLHADKILDYISADQRQSAELTDQMVEDYFRANPELKKNGITLENLKKHRETIRNELLSEDWKAKADAVQSQERQLVNFFETNLPAFDSLGITWKEFCANPQAYYNDVNRKADEIARMIRGRR